MRPTFRQLDRGEIQAILARNQVGRMVYPRGARLEVEPVQYLYDGGWLYGRATRSAFPVSSDEGWWPAAFEVDEIESPLDWRTVIVHGGFYTLLDDGTEWERNERARAIEHLRRLTPAAFTDDDPTPALDVVFRIAVQEVSGRAAASEVTMSDGTAPEAGIPGGGEPVSPPGSSGAGADRGEPAIFEPGQRP